MISIAVYYLSGTNKHQLNKSLFKWDKQISIQQTNTQESVVLDIVICLLYRIVRLLWDPSRIGYFTFKQPIHPILVERNLLFFI